MDAIREGIREEWGDLREGLGALRKEWGDLFVGIRTHRARKARHAEWDREETQREADQCRAERFGANTIPSTAIQPETITPDPPPVDLVPEPSADTRDTATPPRSSDSKASTAAGGRRPTAVWRQAEIDRAADQTPHPREVTRFPVYARMLAKRTCCSATCPATEPGVGRFRSIHGAKARRPGGRFAARMPMNTGRGWLTELPIIRRSVV